MLTGLKIQLCWNECDTFLINQVIYLLVKIWNNETETTAARIIVTVTPRPVEKNEMKCDLVQSQAVQKHSKK